MRSLPLLLIAVAGLLFSNQPSAPTPASTARPVYKNPLDVTVDEKGETARVVLTGPRAVAVVDVKAGRVIKEEPWPDRRAITLSIHDENLQRLSDARRDQMKRYLGCFNDSGRKPPPELTNLRAVAVGTKDIAPLVFVHQRAKTSVPATQISQGWTFTNVITSLKGEGHFAVTIAVPLDDARNGVADPFDVVIEPQGQFAFVAAGGADAIFVVDLFRLDALFRKPPPAEVKEEAYPVVEKLTSGSQFVTARVPTQSNPRRLGLSGDGKTLVVSNYLSDSLTVIDTENLKVVKHISLDGPKPDAARRGEMLFNSAKLTQFGQFTCASCHPNGGADGLNWDLPRDGIGNPKNTKSLLGVKDTAPYGWLGTSATLADRVRGTLRTLHRYEPSEEEVSDLVAYLETLEAPTPPLRSELVKEQVEAIDRGKRLFEGKAGCITCHSGPTFQDGKSHNVGTGTIEGEDRFDTPSLRGVSLTAPYLHDGRAATLEEIFTKHNARKQHGAADKLTAEELADLAAYLKSL